MQNPFSSRRYGGEREREGRFAIALELLLPAESDSHMAIDGVIFDLDGTLVDTNNVHVEAWRRVMQSHGYRVPPDLFFLEMGKGGDTLVPDLLGREAEERDGEQMRA